MNIDYRILFASIVGLGASGVLFADPPATTGTAGNGSAPAAVETIVCVRHGEKPKSDLGQINFQGLNRALALPSVLISKYGKPAAIFAAGSQHKIVRSGTQYSYVRPLITIEPTAIRLGMPVEAKFAYDEIEPLQGELLSPAYRSAVIYVAWEHHYLEQMLRNVVASLGGDAAVVPEWKGDDFDSIYVVRIRSENGRRTVTFAHDQEGLNGMSSLSPEARKKD